MDSLKLKFFLLHLTTSLVVVIGITLTCQFLWFPTPFLQIDGTWIALLTLAGVDITLGPILTLLLVSSKKSKHELLTDMLIIITIQISALGYGLMKIEQEQVWAIVHLDGAFNIVAKKEISGLQLTAQLQRSQYNGIYYAMLLNSDITEHIKTSSHPFLFSPDKYHQLAKEQLIITSFSYNNLPLYIKEKYDQKFIFKVLVGKKRNAIVVLTNNMQVIDILLLPE